MKNEDFGMRGLRRDGNAEDAWATSQNSKSYGKSISIETANLREYARYVLRTICQQVLIQFQMASTLNMYLILGRQLSTIFFIIVFKYSPPFFPNNFKFVKEL